MDLKATYSDLSTAITRIFRFASLYCSSNNLERMIARRWGKTTASGTCMWKTTEHVKLTARGIPKNTVEFSLFSSHSQLVPSPLPLKKPHLP